MTAYEMRISDWSSDVCSSDLWRQRGYLPVGAADRSLRGPRAAGFRPAAGAGARAGGAVLHRLRPRADLAGGARFPHGADLPQLFLPDARGDAGAEFGLRTAAHTGGRGADRKSTRLNSSH